VLGKVVKTFNEGREEVESWTPDHSTHCVKIWSRCLNIFIRK